VSRQSILPSWDRRRNDRVEASGNSGSLPTLQSAIPRFDVACCSSGCRNSFLLRHYFSSCPELRVVALALKRWATARAQVVQARRGWLSPYALTLMVVYWAQQRGLVQPPELPVGQVSSFDIDDDPRWSFPDMSHLFDARRCFIPHADETVEDAVARDAASPPSGERSVGQLLFDFFAFYSEEFDRDTHVADIRCGRGRVLTRGQWKEQVCAGLQDNTLEVFGIEHVPAAMLSSDAAARALRNIGGVGGRDSVAPASCLSTQQLVVDGGGGGGESDDERLERVSKHLFGHDVVSIRDPVEAHSVTRGLDFFRAEALWEEIRLALSCRDPTLLLGLE